MPFFSFRDIEIAAVAAAVPKETVSVDSYSQQFGEETVERFKAMTGIKQFHRSAEHQTASDLGYVAAEKLIEEQKLDRQEIGALVFASHAMDYRRPATACVLHKRLGLRKECAAYDLGLGCSASVYGIINLCSLMASSDIDTALLIVGETPSKVASPKDQSVAMLFGDAGAAILLKKTSGAEIKGLLRTDGNGYRAIVVPAGGFRNIDAAYDMMEWPDGNVRSLYNTYMNGTNVFSFTITAVPRAIKDFWEKSGTSVADYDCFAFHQANQYISKQLCKKLKIPEDKMPLCLDRYGNTSAPAIPLTLCDAYGTNQSDSLIRTLLCGFGVGLSWGVVSATLKAQNIYEVVETDDWFREGFINEPF